MQKKLFDIVGASLLLLLVTPLMVLIGLWVKATSAGPVIFRQVRIGYHGKPFVILKFRTMRDKSGRVDEIDIVREGDARITRIGRVLRKTHLDELPQLFNVLRGDMSLVGPRPMSAARDAYYTRVYPEEVRERHDLMPGLTGLTQLRGRAWVLRKGGRGILRFNRFYRRRQSFWLDLRILAGTVKAIWQRTGE